MLSDIQVNLAAQLNVTGVWNISFSDVSVFFTACSFDVAVFGEVRSTQLTAKQDKFCALFDNETLVEQLLYYYDLDAYWIKVLRLC